MSPCDTKFLEFVFLVDKTGHYSDRFMSVGRAEGLVLELMNIPMVAFRTSFFPASMLEIVIDSTKTTSCRKVSVVGFHSETIWTAAMGNAPRTVFPLRGFI
ncbi:hypothetical protein RA27_03930 [Ruegeria sp. ANG-R]|nr:hypothetical protein RA27_03930 [Ruegeria sp. ANG-R]